MPQKLRQMKNNLKKKLHENFHKENKKHQYEADQYFNPPVILIGNKTDQTKRQVHQKTAKEKAQELGNIHSIPFLHL